MTIRKKRGDTLIGTIEKKYNIKLDVRKDMELGNYLERKGLPSLSRLIDKNRNKR
jgi:hypothetical protein